MLKRKPSSSRILLSLVSMVVVIFILSCVGIAGFVGISGRSLWLQSDTHMLSVIPISTPEAILLPDDSAIVIELQPNASGLCGTGSGQRLTIGKIQIDLWDCNTSGNNAVLPARTP